MRTTRRRLPVIVGLLAIAGLGVSGVIAIRSGADLAPVEDARRDDPPAAASAPASASPAVLAAGAGSAASPNAGAGSAASSNAGAGSAPSPTQHVLPSGAALPDHEVRAQLAAIGKRKLDELSALQVWPESRIDWARKSEAEREATYRAKREEASQVIAAIGPCVRPTAVERARLAKRIAAAERAKSMEDVELRFGCKESSGIVIDLVRHLELGKVFRASDVSASAQLTTLFDRGAPPSTHGTDLTPLVLADLDGDGVKDLLVMHHGGDPENHSPIYYAGLSAWLSMTRRRVALDSSERDMEPAVAMQTWRPGAPLVIRFRDAGEEGDAPKVPDRYRCVALGKRARGTATGSLQICPAAAAARQIERATEIATGFVQGTTYPPHDSALPDRHLLEQLLGELGSQAVEIATLAAQVAPADPAVQVARALERIRDDLAVPRTSLLHGERVAAAPPDPREDALLRMLGDERCPAMSAAMRKRVTAKISRWLSTVSEELMQQHLECTAGQACQWKKAKLEEVVGCPTSDADPDGLYAVRWWHMDVGRDGRHLVSEALVALDGGKLSLVTAHSAEHDPPPLQIVMYRRGGQALALVSSPYTPPAEGRVARPAGLAIVIGTKLTAIPAPHPWFGRGEWYEWPVPWLMHRVELREEKYWRDGRPLEYWHWEDGWRRIASFARPGLADPVPPLDAVGTWLWHQQRRVLARQLLDRFELERWKTPAYRDDVQRALLIAGADQATRAEVAALAKQP